MLSGLYPETFGSDGLRTRRNIVTSEAREDNGNLKGGVQRTAKTTTQMAQEDNSQNTLQLREKLSLRMVLFVRCATGVGKVVTLHERVEEERTKEQTWLRLALVTVLSSLRHSSIGLWGLIVGFVAGISFTTISPYLKEVPRLIAALFSDASLAELSSINPRLGKSRLTQYGLNLPIAGGLPVVSITHTFLDEITS